MHSIWSVSESSQNKRKKKKGHELQPPPACAVHVRSKRSQFNRYHPGPWSFSLCVWLNAKRASYGRQNLRSEYVKQVSSPPSPPPLLSHSQAMISTTRRSIATISFLSNFIILPLPVRHFPTRQSRFRTWLQGSVLPSSGPSMNWPSVRSLLVRYYVPVLGFFFSQLVLHVLHFFRRTTGACVLRYIWLSWLTHCKNYEQKLCSSTTNRYIHS